MADAGARRVAVAIGSNLGDRLAAVDFAVSRLTGLLDNLQVSTPVETEPEGDSRPDDPLYLNAVAVGETSRTPRQLLDALLAIEREYGRERPFPGAPRTLDLDLILAGDLIVAEPDLEVPHPRFRDRFFVLGPLSEVASDFRDPVTGLTAGALLKRLLADEGR